MNTLTMLSAPSASGKSTLAKEMMEKDSNLVRINRDSLRAFTILKWLPSREGYIIDCELAMADAAAKHKKNIVIDDTNLRFEDEQRWRYKAKQLGYNFEKKTLNVSLEECVKRDSCRGLASIGRSAIERQFLKAGLWNIDNNKDTVIFDIDGTLADCQHRVPWITVGADCPNCKGKGKLEIPVWSEGIQLVTFHPVSCDFCTEGKITKKNHNKFYDLVYYDEPIEIVINWIKACYGHFNVLIVSGRSPEKSEELTLKWLEKKHGIKFDHFIMRRANMHGPDDQEKQLILDMILTAIPKEKIAFVVDDRPSVVAMWKKNGIKTFPVRGKDDDKFYELMTDLEVTHPQSLEAPSEECSSTSGGSKS